LEAGARANATTVTTAAIILLFKAVSSIPLSTPDEETYTTPRDIRTMTPIFNLLANFIFATTRDGIKASTKSAKMLKPDFYVNESDKEKAKLLCYPYLLGCNQDP
jgi:sugar (pentulose or hexulose) kinase